MLLLRSRKKIISGIDADAYKLKETKAMERSKEPKNNLPHTRRLKNVRRQTTDGKDRMSKTKKEEMVLESVLGVTVQNSAAISISKSGGLVNNKGYLLFDQ